MAHPIVNVTLSMMFPSSGKRLQFNRSMQHYEDLFIDEHGGVLIVDVDCSVGREIQ